MRPVNFCNQFKEAKQQRKEDLRDRQLVPDSLDVMHTSTPSQEHSTPLITLPKTRTLDRIHATKKTEEGFHPPQRCKSRGPPLAPGDTPSSISNCSFEYALSSSFPGRSSALDTGLHLRNAYQKIPESSSTKKDRWYGRAAGSRQLGLLMSIPSLPSAAEVSSLSVIQIVVAIRLLLELALERGCDRRRNRRIEPTHQSTASW